ncbi:MAG: hypothetical protein R3C52_07285 [Hyphomonadaceae bacterium]
MSYAFLIASGLCAFALVMHLFAGRTPPAPGAGENDNDIASGDAFLRMDAWYGRHLTSLVLLAMLLGFGHVARHADAHFAGLILGGLGAAAGVLRLLLSLRLNASRFETGICALTAAAGALGILGAYL